MLKKTFILSALSLFIVLPSFAFANTQQDNSSEINIVKPDAKSDTVNSESSQQLMRQPSMIQN